MSIEELSDNNAESGVIATLIYHPEFILQTDYLHPEYFYANDNACIYWAIQELYKQGIDNIDALNISTMLHSNPRTKKAIEKYNLPSFNEYIDMCKNVARDSFDEYKLLTDIVVELAFKRDLYKLTNIFERSCFNREKSLNTLNKEFYDGLGKLTEKYIVCGKVEAFGKKVDSLWDEICNRRTENGLYGIPSKYPLLNEYFTYEPGELILISARMKQGKSMFMMNEAIHKLQNGIPTLYIDTEMSDVSFLERMLANLTGIPIRDIKNGNYTYKEDKLLGQYRDWIKQQPFVHEYMPIVSQEEIFKYNKILKHKIGLQFSIFDYIKSDEPDSVKNYNILGAFTGFLKNEVAGALDLSVLAGTQFNRSNEVADSDKIERYISVNINWRPKTQEEIVQDGIDCGNYAASIGINRLGARTNEDEYIDFIMDGKRARIEAAKTHEAEENPFY